MNITSRRSRNYPLSDSKRRFRLVLVTACWFLAACWFADVRIRAQDASSHPTESVEQVVSTNPIGLPFLWWNGEYELRIRPSTTVGLDASSTSLRSFSGGGYTDLKFFVRPYHDGTAFKGSYIGFTGGIYRFGDARFNTFVPGVGVDWGYAWLLGSRRNLSVNVGGGITYFPEQSSGDSFTVLPNIRLNFGFGL